MDRLAEALRRIVPHQLKRKLKKLFFMGGRYYCNVCDSSLKKFIPAGYSNKAIENLDIIGAGYYSNDVCPVCDSSYRTRAVVALLEDMQLTYHDKRILHIAPEQGLYDYFTKKSPLNYVCGDINPEKYSHFASTVFVDLTKISFPSESFDLIICNHVLEHIPDDEKAMGEIFRVLSKGGRAVLQVPVSTKLKQTLEDDSVDTPEKRLVEYGQDDHVRVYTQSDYLQKLTDAGLMVSVTNTKNLIKDAKHEKLAMDKREDLFLCVKP
jgi:SAM-dependent methyltransferase